MKTPFARVYFQSGLFARVTLNPNDTFSGYLRVGSTRIPFDGIRLPAMYRHAYDSLDAFGSVAKSAVSFMSAESRENERLLDAHYCDDDETVRVRRFL